MSKPASLPRWNTDASNRTDPASGQKDTGWTSGQFPPSSYFNWWMNLVYAWTVWLNGLQGEVLTWTAAQTYTNSGAGTTITVTGGSGSNAHGVDATGGATSGAGLVGRGGGGASTGVVGIGASANGVGGSFTPGGTGAGVVANAGSTGVAVSAGGNVDFSSVTNPASTAAVNKNVGPANFCKAFGSLTTDGAGNVAVNGGINIKSAVISGSTILVTFNDNGHMANTGYSVTVTPQTDTTNRLIVSWDSKTTSSFVIRSIKDDGATTHNFGTLAATVDFQVQGLQ